LAEDGVSVGYCHQIDVIIVDDVLRIFEAVVSADEMIDCRCLDLRKLVAQHDVENLSRSLIVVRQASFAQFLSGTVELPVDALHWDEYQPQQLEQNGPHKTPSYQY